MKFGSGGVVPSGCVVAERAWVVGFGVVFRSFFSIKCHDVEYVNNLQLVFGNEASKFKHSSFKYLRHRVEVLMAIRRDSLKCELGIAVVIMRVKGVNNRSSKAG